MRGFLLGAFLVAAISLTVLAIRPGGLRQQLRFAARRFRIALALGGVFVLGSLIIRLVSASGPAADYGPPLLALGLGVIFLFAGRDPSQPKADSARGPRR
ncbi:MAG TPA: hypothetical protein VGG31_02535 [Candidatus Dormibacteraeota bacterium]|jgi:hypothetical protein